VTFVTPARRRELTELLYSHTLGQFVCCSDRAGPLQLSDMSETHNSKRSTLAHSAASKLPAVSRGKALVNWTDCLNLETSKLAHKVDLLWILCAELEAGRCKTIGAHQLSSLLENLAPLKHCALLDDVGKHFIRRLLSYGMRARSTFVPGAAYCTITTLLTTWCANGQA